MDRWCSDAFVLRALSAAKTTTTVDYKRGADVNRLRNDVFVLRVLRCLTFEVRRGRRQSARPGGRMINLTWSRAWWFAVGPQPRVLASCTKLATV